MRVFHIVLAAQDEAGAFVVHVAGESPSNSWDARPSFDEFHLHVQGSVLWGLADRHYVLRRRHRGHFFVALADDVL